ncbi:Luminescence regulatory protein LuxO [Maioricimonas rarisocia]|uniref:Luminescence regulatory protein LuxO n=1 Tax=Maioricimonas rarisocia TaxID=2528026 RepID=A0A517ZA29_9PLAN|nr:response regulator [Maioricimonas rarisocia]QDU39347.1 Luminescence regulatory protein LuxO [Maioricimonas rarisocia]
MTTILIVDDNPVEQRYVARVLRSAIEEFEVIYADDGRDAVVALNRQPVDLVLTDLHMPEMNGLELLSVARRQFRDVPIVIMTSRGSEQAATDALRRGAANYIPKKALEAELPDLCSHVLELSRQRREEEEAAAWTVQQRIVFELPSRMLAAAKLARHLQKMCSSTSRLDGTTRARLGVAVEEALLNAVVHGNLEIGSELREFEDESFAELVGQREKQSPYCERTVRVVYESSESEIRFVIRDQGPGFDVAQLPDAASDENLMKASGRGILLMRCFMDEVSFNGEGTEVTMVLRLGVSPGNSADTADAEEPSGQD